MRVILNRVVFFFRYRHRGGSFVVLFVLLLIKLHKPILLAIHIAFNENPTVIPVEPIHDVDPIYEKDHMLKFNCTVVIPHHARKYVFDVEWTIDGKQIKAEKNLNLASLQHKVLLIRDEWKDKVPRRLGFKVRCAIRARELRNSLPTIFKESSEFYAGIVVDTNKLTVNAGETAFVQIHSTVPITCREIGGRRPNCVVRFEMLDFSAELRSTNLKKFCKDQKLTKSSRLCGVKFNGWQWGKNQNLTIPTKADQQIRGDFPAIVKLRSIGIDSDMLWNNYELPDIKINIRGPDFKPAIGRSVTDPHITTFDGSYFTTFETGEYVLYKHTEKPIAVHVIHKSLGSPPPWNCAVAVRAASDIFIVYGCDKRWRHRRAFCDSVHGSYLDVYERNQGKEFEIHLPTGARVVINLYSYGTERYLDVHIFASTLDEKKTAGLCGIFNRRKNDDFTTPQGKVVQKREFQKSWSVKTDDSLFIAKSRGGVIARSQYFCSCVKTENGVNIFSQTANCNWDDSIKVCPTPSWSEQQCKFRHRRSTNTEENEMDIDIPEDIVQYQPAPPNIDTWRNGWNQSKALDLCTKVLHKSAIYNSCKDLVSIDEQQLLLPCVQDIKFMGSPDLSSQVDKPLKEMCINIVRINSTLWSDKNDTSDSVVASMTSAILENDCPNDCSVGEEKRGTCINGTCTCFANFTGDDCSVDTKQPPKIESNDNDNKCDISKKECLYLTFFGDNFYDDNSDLKCRFEEQQLSNSTGRSNNVVHMTEADMVSFGEVRCPLASGNTRKRRDLSAAPSSSFLVSITTNGNTFSNKIPVVVYDSACTDCFHINGAFNCKQKDNICVVNGKCFDLTSSECLSHTSMKPTEKSSDKLWIIGAVLGGLAVLIVVVLLVVKVIVKPRTEPELQTPNSSMFMSSKPVYVKT